MRVIIQRVSSASVTVEGKLISEIEKGLLILLGVGKYDTEEDIPWLINKISQLRIFPDDNGNMNKSIIDKDYNIIVVSQFTLFASTKKGNRPSFVNSAKPDIAKPLYEKFIIKLEEKLGKTVGQGIFGADMKVSLLNDGPVTISIDTKNKE